MKIVIILLLPFILCACTYSINMVHTQGLASDVIDETQSADPDIKADVSVPAI